MGDSYTVREQRKGGARMPNLELLRCIGMMLVVVLHYLGKGMLLPDLNGEALGTTGVAAWLLESFAIVAVNVYMLISGYFLCTSSFKLSRLIKLYLQLWVYSVGIGVLAAATGILPAAEVNTHYLLSLVFPISMGHYWFMSAYIFLYLLLPFLGAALCRLNRQRLQLVIALLLGVFCLLKSILPVRLELDGTGMDCIWYLCVFAVAAYIRRFGWGFLEKRWHSILLYVLGVLAVFGGAMALRQVYLHTGSLERMLTVTFEYNHGLNFLASLGLFGLFLKLTIPEKMAGVVNAIAPYTLGVYLLHENLGVRNSWPAWLGAAKVTGTGALLLYTLGAVLLVFTLGILVDYVRTRLMACLHACLLHLGLYRRIRAWVERADQLFKES